MQEQEKQLGIQMKQSDDEKEERISDKKLLAKHEDTLMKTQAKLESDNKKSLANIEAKRIALHQKEIELQHQAKMKEKEMAIKEKELSIHSKEKK